MLVYFLLSWFTMLGLGKLFVAYIAPVYFRSQAREYTPETHRAKDFTPTMGGLCMVTSLISMMALIDLFIPGTITSSMAIIALMVLGFAAIGAWDDYHKIFYKKGISERKKFIGQVIVATITLFLWYWLTRPSTLIVVPYMPLLSFDPGPVLFIAWAVWVILCTVNAVNFTDGLDGLATLILLANFTLFGLVAYMFGMLDITLICVLIVGILLGFLWYNAYPAQMFMGDAGSLPLGAALAMVALMTKTELLIPLAGGIFVIEGISVAAQIVWFKMTGNRLLKMAPIHHHFELLGYTETQVTMRFFIVTILLCVIAWFCCSFY